jgi:hypothetical protein
MLFRARPGLAQRARPIWPSKTLPTLPTPTIEAIFYGFILSHEKSSGFSNFRGRSHFFIRENNLWLCEWTVRRRSTIAFGAAPIAPLPKPMKKNSTGALLSLDVNQIV